jgi:hypothetical protein
VAQGLEDEQQRHPGPKPPGAGGVPELVGAHGGDLGQPAALEKQLPRPAVGELALAGAEERGEGTLPRRRRSSGSSWAERPWGSSTALLPVLPRSWSRPSWKEPRLQPSSSLSLAPVQSSNETRSRLRSSGAAEINRSWSGSESAGSGWC